MTKRGRRITLLFLSPRRLWGVDGQRHAPAALPLEQWHGTNCTEGWVGPRAGLDGCGKSCPNSVSIPWPSNSQRVAIPTELSVTNKYITCTATSILGLFCCRMSLKYAKYKNASSAVTWTAYFHGRVKMMKKIYLCLWFRVSLIHINNCPMRCHTKQCIYYSASSLYMFRVSTTPIIRSTQKCN